MNAEQYIFDDRYLVWPLKESDVGNNRYVAALTIPDISEEDGGNFTSYSLVIHQVPTQAFLDVFPQLSPTQVGETLSFSKIFLSFSENSLSLFNRMEIFSKIP